MNRRERRYQWKPSGVGGVYRKQFLLVLVDHSKGEFSPNSPQHRNAEVPHLTTIDLPQLSYS